MTVSVNRYRTSAMFRRLAIRLKDAIALASEPNLPQAQFFHARRQAETLGVLLAREFEDVNRADVSPRH